jgi:hypothetical protein
MKENQELKTYEDSIKAFLKIPAVAEALTIWLNNKDDSVVEFKPVFPPDALVAGTWIVDTSNWVDRPRRIGSFEKIGDESMIHFTDNTEMLVSHMLGQPWYRPARCIPFTAVEAVAFVQCHPEVLFPLNDGLAIIEEIVVGVDGSYKVWTRSGACFDEIAIVDMETADHRPYCRLEVIK